MAWKFIVLASSLLTTALITGTMIYRQSGQFVFKTDRFDSDLTELAIYPQSFPSKVKYSAVPMVRKVWKDSRGSFAFKTLPTRYAHAFPCDSSMVFNLFKTAASRKSNRFDNVPPCVNW